MIFNRLTDSEFIARFTSLGRTLNLRYFPNLLLIILLPIVAIAGVAVAFAYDTNPDPRFENSVSMALIQGFWSVVGFLVTWVLAREIDPDYDFSAFFAGFLFLPVLWALPAIRVAPIEEVTNFGLLAMVVLILSVRVVDRLVGPAPKWTDSFAVLGIALLLLPFNNWMMALVPMIAFVLDGILRPPLYRHFLFAIVIAVAVVLRFVQVGLQTAGALTIGNLILVTAISLLYVGTIAATTQVRKGTDVPGHTVSLSRVRAGMGLVLFAGLLMFLWLGDNGLQAMLPAWTAMIGVMLFRLPVTLFRLSRNTPQSLADKLDKAGAMVSDTGSIASANTDDTPDGDQPEESSESGSSEANETPTKE